ncbi:bifunctional hydroxymethylpyrimidine kinase/phosphomethylpyrimidine kinase [Acidiferrimicrobium sp. IK]|nr:PfkB family carbohydrate kinase [Acidiferrimicrobium sp. IK]MCU4185877.1 bifunctional hydroxymethylpyrimidine kinase/phosphomethylpyrimidine kinase [Acidiferrimicrobium sp. IK]
MTVVGSLNLDHVVGVERLPTEGATVAASAYSTGAGGKGLNQAVAAARQGAAVAMVGAVGDDDAGRGLLALLAGEGIDAGGVRVDDGRPTGLALITVAEGGANTIVVVAGANAGVTEAAAAVTGSGSTQSGAVATEPAGAGLAGRPRDVVLTQLEIPLAAVRAALRAARDADALGILNPAPAAGPLPADVLALASIVVPNETEARALTGEADPEAAAVALVAAGCPAAIVTVGEAGAVVAQPGRVFRVPAFPVTPVDTTAAGDAFCGTLAAALAGGALLADAVRRACAAGSLAAAAPGAVASLPGAAAVAALTG